MDFGLLGALQGKRNWGEMRDSKLRELQYQQGLNSIADQKVKDQQIAQQEMAQYMNIVNNIQVDDIGKEKIRNATGELKAPIAEAIKKYGGDLSKYMAVQGKVDLDNYSMALYHHPVTQRELSNQVALNHYQADQKAGLMSRVEFDAQGNPVNPIDQQIEARKNGTLDLLNYKGGFKPGKFDDKVFGERYGSPNKYEKRAVDSKDYADTMYQQLVNQGIAPQDARQQAIAGAKQYAQHLGSQGTPLYYKSDNWTPQMSLAQAKYKALQSKGGKEGSLGWLAGIQKGLIAPNDIDHQGGFEIYDGGTPNGHAAANILGAEINEKDGTVKNWGSFSRNKFVDIGGSPIDLSGVDASMAKISPLLKVIKDSKGNLFYPYRVQLSDKALEEAKKDGNPLKGGWFSANQKLGGDEQFPAQFKTNWYGGAKEGDFIIMQPLPPTVVATANDVILSKQASKSGQDALRLGYQVQEQDAVDTQMLQDLQDDTE